eukprot:761205-Hanusia_phi.AAC.7
MLCISDDSLATFGLAEDTKTGPSKVKVPVTVPIAAEPVRFPRAPTVMLIELINELPADVAARTELSLSQKVDSEAV